MADLAAAVAAADFAFVAVVVVDRTVVGHIFSAVAVAKLVEYHHQ